MCVIRLKDKKIISLKKFEGIYAHLLREMESKLAIKKIGDKSTGGNYYNTMNSRVDRNFIYAVNRRVKEGKIVYTKAYDLVGAKGLC